MEKFDKSQIKSIISSAGKTVKGLANGAIQAIDQDADGKFDLTDVSIIKESVNDAVKKGAQAVAENIEGAAKNYEVKTLRPLFPEDLEAVDFFMPKFIRVTERDKKHADSEVCRGSIGYRQTIKGYDMVNVFQDSAAAFSLKLLPDSVSEFYYEDPIERGCYIALDEYFNHLKKARVNELQLVAQNLGAKYFKVTYKEEKARFAEKKMKVAVKSKQTVGMEADLTQMQKSFSTIEVAAEMSFPGHEPVRPQLKYLQRDSSVQTLIDMRMNEKSPLLNQKLVIKLSNTSGMKEKDALKIDTALKILKCTGNVTVESEVKNEARRYLEYDIRF